MSFFFFLFSGYSCLNHVLKLIPWFEPCRVFPSRRNLRLDVEGLLQLVHSFQVTLRPVPDEGVIQVVERIEIDDPFEHLPRLLPLPLGHFVGQDPCPVEGGEEPKQVRLGEARIGGHRLLEVPCRLLGLEPVVQIAYPQECRIAGFPSAWAAATISLCQGKTNRRMSSGESMVCDLKPQSSLPMTAPSLIDRVLSKVCG